MADGEAGWYTLDPALPVLPRPDGAVQVGWHPRRAVLVSPPRGLTAPALATLLQAMQPRVAVADLRDRATKAGLVDAAEFARTVADLAAAGVVQLHPPRADGGGTQAMSIRVHGRGPLSDLITSALRCSGALVRHTSQRGAALANADLVVLSDYLVTDSAMVRQLHASATPHLLVRVRDGTGLVGPMVLPGRTSCTECADLHRSERDPAWPAVAEQLRGAVGSADRATVLATAALALSQVDRVMAAVRGEQPRRAPTPPVFDTTLEFDVHAASVLARRWTRHPRCACSVNCYASIT